MKDGIIYPCNTIAGIEHFNKYFNQNMKVSSGDILELSKVRSIKEVYEFLCSPKPFCKYSNRKGVEFGITYGNSKKILASGRKSKCENQTVPSAFCRLETFRQSRPVPPALSLDS
jgi:hypothetical protein